MNQAAAEKFAKAYNEYVDMRNASRSDGGKNPYRRGSFMYEGYDAARRVFLSQQLQNKEMNGGQIRLDKIQPEQSENVLNSINAWFKKAAGF